MSAHVSPPPSEGGGVKGLVGGAILVIALVLAIVFVYATREKDPPSNTYSRSGGSYAPPAAKAVPVDALVLQAECWTPCSTNIDYKFKIRGEGNPLRVTFPGVGAVDYPGEGDFKAPSQMRSGETHFVSLNAERPNVRVQIYKKITVDG